MATSARIGSGVQFAIGAGSGPIVYTDVAEVTSINPPGRTRETREATHFNSGGFRDFVGGLRDSGEAAITANFTAAGYTTLQSAFNATTAGNFRIAFGASGAAPKVEFSGFATDLGLEIPLDDVVHVTFAVKATGDLTYTAS